MATLLVVLLLTSMLFSVASAESSIFDDDENGLYLVYSGQIVESYIRVTQYAESSGVFFEISLEEYAEEYQEFTDITDYEITYYRLIDDMALKNSEMENKNGTRMQPPKSNLEYSEELTNSYNNVCAYAEEIGIAFGVTMDTFVEEYYNNGYDSAQEYEEVYYRILVKPDVMDAEHVQSFSSDGKWYYDTKTSLPQKANYSSYNLLASVQKGDIIHDSEGSWGISGHSAIVEGKFYDTNYDQFYIRLVEAVGPGVCRGVLDDQRVDERRSSVIRVPNASMSNKHTAVSFCISQIGKYWLYDAGHDTSSTPSSWYCSELVWAAYKKSYIDIESNDGSPGVMPYEIYNNKNLNKVTTNGSKPSRVFNDISNNHAKTEIAYLADNGFVNGTSSNKFSPEENMTRGMFVTLLYRLQGEPSPPQIYNPFRDVNQSMYYYDAVLWAYRAGLVSGTTTSTFEPNTVFSRQDMATLLYRYTRYRGGNLTYNASAYNSYSDRNQVADYAQVPLQWALNHRILSRVGYYLQPKYQVKRSDMAYTYYNLISRVLN